MTEFIEAKAWKQIYRNERNFFTITQALVNEEMEILVGFFPIFNEGLVMHCHVKKELGPRKTMQYKVESYSIELPTSPYNLFRFLRNDFFNLKEQVAKEIEMKIGVEYLDQYSNKDFLVEKLGEKFYNENQQDFLFTSNRLKQIKSKLQVMETMIKMGFSNDVSSKVSFSDYTVTSEKIKENPYQLIYPFDMKWGVVDQISLRSNISKDSSLRIQEALCYILDEQASNQSHVFIPKGELFQQLKKLLRINMTEDIFDEILIKLSNDNRIFTDIGERVYATRYYNAEEQLANDLYRFHYSDREDVDLVKEMMDYVKQDSFVYSDEQLLAIERALLNPLSIINGPAGTGKTTTLLKIIECLEIMKKRKMKKGDTPYSIKLCAPTGTAAERMKKVTSKDAQTIHSLLAHHPVSKLPSFNEKNPLIDDCYILDEFGMVDVLIGSQIMNAIKVGAKVVIVGDVAQLPSIGPGNVLKELINDSEFVKTELTRVYRQGAESKILDLANSVKDGNTNIHNIISEKSDDLSFIPMNNVSEISRNILNICKILLKKDNFDFINHMQIITPIHKTEIGTIHLNKSIQNLLNEGKERKKIVHGDKVFYVGDKVMHLVNNREKNIYNGETGEIHAIINKTIYVNYSGRKEISYIGDEIHELELAFASTIHKMQGSESPLIIMPIHTSFFRMLLRSLLYTGITRAKSKLMLLGEKEALIKGISDIYATERNSSLKERFLEARLVELFN